MAIYHLHAQVIQRSKGKNAVSSAAYRRATTLHDDKEGRDWNYSNKKGVTHSELLIPDNAPLWAKELLELHEIDPDAAAEKLWNLVEANEKRIDSQLAREIELSLPIELTAEQNIKLAREFIKDQFVLRGMIADWNVHWDEGNPHIHVMLTMRELIQEGFGKKVTVWNSKLFLQGWRESWAEYANYHLKLNQHNVRIDHRSYEDQGIDLIPTIHQGKAVSDMDARGIKTSIMEEANQIRRENLNRISENPNVLLDKLTSQGETFSLQQLGQELGRYINDQGKFTPSSREVLTDITLRNLRAHSGSDVREGLNAETLAKIFTSIEAHDSAFTENQIAKAVNKITDNAELFAKAMAQIKSSPNLIPLGVGEDGRSHFTTRKMFHIENDIQHLADLLRDRKHLKISQRTMDRILCKHQSITGKELTSEQKEGVKHLLRPTSISCLVGRAGTGKSFSLGAAKAVWEAKGLKVQGVALSGIAADGLNKDVDIASRTIESFCYAIEKGNLRLTPQDVVVMDEAGMTDSVSMRRVMLAIRNADAKLVLVGDHAQLQPVGPGASFRALIERIGFKELQNVYRQKEQWQREATKAFSEGSISKGVSAYDYHGCVHFEHTQSEAMKRLVRDWSVAQQQNPTKDLSEFLVVTDRNVDVRQLNTLLRNERIQAHEISEGYAVETASGEIHISKGDRLLFLKNDRSIGVTNGRFATIHSVNFTESGRVINLTVKLDGTKETIQIDPSNYNNFALGYAATVHKTQGITVDHSYYYAGPIANRNATYVALTRHRHTCHIYADKENHESFDRFRRKLGRFATKDSVLDFPVEFSKRRGIDSNGLFKVLSERLAQRLAAMRDGVQQRLNPKKYAERLESIRTENNEREETKNRRQNAKLVSEYVDARNKVGEVWQKIQEKNFKEEKNGISSEKKILQTSTTLLQEALILRNEKAFQIMQNFESYTIAIDRHNIDGKQLKKHANGYEARQLVASYHSYCNQGEILLRDKTAARIFQNLKTHFSQIRQFNIETDTLKKHALAHLTKKPEQVINVESNISSEKQEMPSENNTESIKTLLLRYVELQLEQTRLVKEMHTVRLTDPSSSKEVREKALAHSILTNDFIKQLIMHPDIKAEISKVSNTKQTTNMSHSDEINAIYQRLLKGRLSSEDLTKLIIDIQKHSKADALSQSNQRNHGSRSL